MLPICFIFFFLLISSKPSTSSGNTTDQLAVLLGCRAVIPCQQSSSGSDSFKWFYKKDEHREQVQIFFRDRSGIVRHDAFLPRRVVMPNRSLVINHFTENDQGMYWCVNCRQDKCWDKQSAVIRVKKGILSEMYKLIYIAEGESFTHECPGEFTDFNWTFKGNNELMTSNKSIHIVKVKQENTGKYTCWTTLCNGHIQNLLTINLCVVTGWDVIFNNTNSSVAVNTSQHVDLFGSIMCSAKQMFDGYTTVSHVPLHIFNQTTEGDSRELLPVIYGTSVVLGCLILVTIFCFRSRLRAAFPVHLCLCCSNGRVSV
ncbi:uncharacterized protein LOC114448804 isoform X2 [Parambassis ranga]|uniref:Uncharacterized protein LOC114448804 isoform X2 n=1 Tax=Parambassis ranga TaxID=210632 RepID=A0A6P7JXW8_9TELE|nr:uncharacterized protein LOC114448804 isoform X2 [Parambassis ranga]